jgi:hypothetical protein
LNNKQQTAFNINNEAANEKFLIKPIFVLFKKSNIKQGINGEIITNNNIKK